ncbi:MAG: right-handed parallel beta-helix repeat-containing protein, partial [Planctomycetota bacterium]
MKTVLGVVYFATLIFCASQVAMAQTTLDTYPFCTTGSNLDFEIETEPLVPYYFDISVSGSAEGVEIPWTLLTFPLNRPYLRMDMQGAGFQNIMHNFDGLTDAAGHATATLTIPDEPWLIGAHLYGAVIALDYSATGSDGFYLISNPVHSVVVADTDDLDWTDLTPAPGAIVVYVSSSSGADSNSGLSSASPVQTLAHAGSLMRDGLPDQLLLKRGDVWTFESFSSWVKSGESPLAPMVFGAYGTGPRPLIQSGSSTGWSKRDDADVQYIAIVGLHFLAHTYSGSGGPKGIQIAGRGGNFLVEDCKFEGYSTNIVVQGSLDRIHDVAVRYCTVVDSWAVGRHAQGLFAGETDNLLVEGSVFDHNGWNPNIDGANRTVYNHNLYISTSNTGVVVRNNIIARGSSHGLQARSGGLVENNVLIQNALGIDFGISHGGTSPLDGGVTGVVRGNIILEGDDIGSRPRAYGMQIGNIDSAVVHNNIICNDISAEPYGKAIFLNGDHGIGINQLDIHHNTVYNWRGNIALTGSTFQALSISNNIIQSGDPLSQIVTIQNPATAGTTFADEIYFSVQSPDRWFRVDRVYMDLPQFSSELSEVGSLDMQAIFQDPDRSPATYSALIGGLGTVEDFLSKARAQSRYQYDPGYSA